MLKISFLNPIGPVSRITQILTHQRVRENIAGYKGERVKSNYGKNMPTSKNARTNSHTYIHIRTHKISLKNTHIHIYIYIYIYIYVCVCVFMYVCMYVCVCVC